MMLRSGGLRRSKRLGSVELISIWRIMMILLTSLVLKPTKRL
jgi:hypothetical protein